MDAQQFVAVNVARPYRYHDLGQGAGELRGPRPGTALITRLNPEDWSSSDKAAAAAAAAAAVTVPNSCAPSSLPLSSPPSNPSASSSTSSANSSSSPSCSSAAALVAAAVQRPIPGSTPGATTVVMPVTVPIGVPAPGPVSGPASSMSFGPPDFTGLSYFTTPQLCCQHQQPPLPPAPLVPTRYKMGSLQSDEDLAALQKLSSEYEPDVQGPLVGKRQSSHAITAEYANADPAFVRKTRALPQKFSHYRTIKGDGNCGWRAIAFGYFEALLRLGDKNQIEAEEARLKSLSNLLNIAGFQEHLYEDFVEETILLLRDVASWVPVADDGAALLEKFNDAGISNAIITHFRLLTSAWMKTHADAYQPFIPDKTVEQYCATQIEPYQVEIEHVGMNALIDCLIKSAGFAVEILYLDRSVGEEVNTIRFELETPAGEPVFPDAPTMRLLYRPGHYDILYKVEDVAELLSSATQVQLVSDLESFSPIRNVPMASTYGQFNPWLAEIPGMSFVPGVPSGLSGLSSLSGFGGLGSLSLMPAGFAPTPDPTIPHPPMTPSVLPIHPAPAITTPSFRPSKYEYEAEFAPPPPANLPCQTATFRNSHYNPAHFLNSEFQPEMWTPDTDSKSDSKSSDHGRGHS